MVSSITTAEDRASVPEPGRKRERVLKPGKVAADAEEPREVVVSLCPQTSAKLRELCGKSLLFCPRSERFCDLCRVYVGMRSMRGLPPQSADVVLQDRYNRHTQLRTILPRKSSRITRQACAQGGAAWQGDKRGSIVISSLPSPLSGISLCLSALRFAARSVWHSF